MSEPLLQIRNHHVAACGDPPVITGANPHVYVGYFENPYGEQWVFTYDHKSKKAELRGGDIGWNSRCEVIDGVVPDLILGIEEATWLQACWCAATAGERALSWLRGDSATDSRQTPS